MRKKRILDAILVIVGIVTWLAVAGMFDKQLMDGDFRHFKDAQVERRRNEAAMKICGNAHATWQDATTLVCQRHTGKGKPVITTGVQS